MGGVMLITALLGPAPLEAKILRYIDAEGMIWQTAPKFYLPQWGIKPTVSHWCNPADLHILTLAHQGPHSARCVALVARRADVYQTRSS